MCSTCCLWLSQRLPASEQKNLFCLSIPLHVDKPVAISYAAFHALKPSCSTVHTLTILMCVMRKIARKNGSRQHRTRPDPTRGWTRPVSNSAWVTPNPSFQSHSIVQRRISRKRCVRYTPCLIKSARVFGVSGSNGVICGLIISKTVEWWRVTLASAGLSCVLSYKQNDVKVVTAVVSLHFAVVATTCHWKYS